MNYKVTVYDNFTKAQTDTAFLDIQQHKDKNMFNVNIFYVLSHGKDTFTYLSKDNEWIDLRQKMQMFYTKQCPAMAFKPQLWFGDFCRGTDDQMIAGTSKDMNESALSEVFDKAVIEVPTYLKYYMSSNTGIKSKINKNGSCFTTTVCEMLENGYHQLDDNWGSQLCKKLNEAGKPNPAYHTYLPFPGEMFGTEPSFSFSYDVTKFNSNRISHLK